MEIHKLEVFIDLTQTLSYTETAERQFTTQSNVSKQIISLEQELNVTLFERAHRKITLSSAGKIILPFAMEIVKNYHTMEQKINEELAKEALSLSILTIPTMANYNGFSLITGFLKDYPEVNIQLKEGEGNQLLPFLEKANNHLIYARTFDTIYPDYDLLLTEKDQFVAVVSKNHPLSHKEIIALEDLKDEKFVMLEKETLLYQPTLDLCGEAGFTPNILFKSSRIDLILNMVQKELGITLLMEKTIDKNWSDSLKIIPVTPTKTSYLSFIRKKETPSEASKMLWHYLKAHHYS